MIADVLPIKAMTKNTLIIAVVNNLSVALSWVSLNHCELKFKQLKVFSVVFIPIVKMIFSNWIKGFGNLS